VVDAGPELLGRDRLEMSVTRANVAGEPAEVCSAVDDSADAAARRPAASAATSVGRTRAVSRRCALISFDGVKIDRVDEWRAIRLVGRNLESKPSRVGASRRRSRPTDVERGNNAASADTPVGDEVEIRANIDGARGEVGPDAEGGDVGAAPPSETGAGPTPKLSDRCCSEARDVESLGRVDSSDATDSPGLIVADRVMARAEAVAPVEPVAVGTARELAVAPFAAVGGLDPLGALGAPFGCRAAG
jgi:hypothetical protein